MTRYLVNQQYSNHYFVHCRIIHVYDTILARADGKVPFVVLYFKNMYETMSALYMYTKSKCALTLKKDNSVPVVKNTQIGSAKRRDK